MKKYFVVISIAIVLISGFVLAQKKSNISLETRWKTVEQLAEKQLPESALKEVDAILAQAQKEKNSAQIIKAMVYKMRFNMEKEPDKAPELIRELENYAQKATDPTEKALLSSMTAELYAQHYQNNRWQINRRTDVVGLVPEDMNEWTRNIYADKVYALLNTSLADADLLQKTNALKFAELLQKGTDSRTLQPTLFEFLAWRKIDVLESLNPDDFQKSPLAVDNYFDDAQQFVQLKPDTAGNAAMYHVVKTFQQILNFRLKSNNVPALINADIERLTYFKANNENTDSIYLVALNRLEKKYSKNESVVEVLAEVASYYKDKSDNNFYDENESATQSINYDRKAYDICANGIKRFHKYKRINLLHNIQAEIKRKEISINHNNETPLANKLKVTVNSKNINKLQLTVYRLNATAKEYADFKEKTDAERDYPNRTLIESREISIKADPDFGKTKTEFFIKPQAYGIYAFSLTEAGNQKKSQLLKATFVVTDLAHIIRSSNPKLADVYVLNRLSGQPQTDVNVKVYFSKWTNNGYVKELKGQYKTNAKGLFQFGFEQNYYNHELYFENGKDCYFSSNTRANYYNRSNVENEKLNVSLLTDRALYRPGQTVYFKAIAYYLNKNIQNIAPNMNLEIALYDANSQKVSSKKLKTNGFGSVAGEFVLPTDGLNGSYSIRTIGGYQNIWVEEYKRPTFEVKIDKPKNEIQFGDKVAVSGTVKAFAGYGINDANVKYRVVRSVHHFCWWIAEPEEEIANGTTKSDAAGSFEVSFTPVRTKSKPSRWADRAYTYTVYCDVTDPKGETQQGEQYVSVGDKSLFIIAEIPQEINKNRSFKTELTTRTINDEVVNSTVKYSIFKLKATDVYNENINEEKELEVAEKVLSGTFETKNKHFTCDLQSLTSGRYKFVFTTIDAHGKEVKLEKSFVLFGADDKRPPVKSYVWLQTSKTNCAVGENAEIQFGTSTQNSMVFYEIMQGNSILESRWIPFSDEIQHFKIPFLESYGAGVTVMFTFMKDEQLFTKSVQLTRKVIEKKLTPTLSVFRNKLLPGEKAEWTVTVPESAKDKKTAELLVGMYDASLDAIRPHSWDFNPMYNEYVLHSPSWSANQFGDTNNSVSFDVLQKGVNDLMFDQLNWFGLNMSNYYGGGRPMRSTARFTAPILKKDEEVFSIADVKGNDNVNGTDMAEVNVSSVADALQGKIAGLDVVNVDKKQEQVKIRTNFNETAFFYPQLRTDADGNVKFTFTAPESLTRWNVKMLAHTPDLYFGKSEVQVVTQKDFMVQMNLPRFVRRSDKLVLNASVINLTDKLLTASVQFELINPATEKPIVLKDNQPKNVTLAANETKVVEWEISEFTPYELVICKVIGRAGNFSDGEQKYLPVLPDKILVTESMPLTIRGNQTRTFKFESLLKNGAKVDTKNLSVEFSSNPAWYAVQALPTLSTPENDNALDYFSAYYVNSLAAFIANSNPKIASTFDRWKNAGGSRDALLSNLQKNTELKNMLLEETPWVMAAQDETEQKRQIALLFDLNMQKNQGKQFLDKLLKLQMASGGFSWFEGMSESRYVTQEIMLNLARLKKMTGQKADERQLAAERLALNYLDIQITNDFENLKKYNKNYQKEQCVSDVQLFYLHMRSEYPEIAIAKVAADAVSFYTTQSEKYWTSFTLYGKAMMAVVAQRNGKTQVATDILKSLKENALKTDEFGMYWAKNTSGYFWGERPIAVQAAIIEAFAEVTKNTADVDEMKIWLLKQKQTQRWDSPTATVNAIYALLLQGSDWLANEGTVKIKVGGKTLEPPTKEAGTGYFKETIPVETVRPEMGKVTVSSIGSATSSRTTNGGSIGWGAMYWQFYQDLDKIEAQGTALKVSKKLFVEKITASGKSMQPIEQTQLKKGDKVITRLVITTDRNLEFVALKDLRASCFEPVDQRSGSQWKESVCYYKTTKDASTQFFFSYLPKGTYVFEYELWVNNSGTYTSGIASVQCQYAPEFVSHTGGEKITVK